jgi:magnesium chelatase family protein
MVGLIGGGSIPHPGEVSMAHRGVLFLDEFPEFGRNSLEALRQPLEDGKVTISRAVGSVDFPARFMLVAAANPCPCGFLGDEKKECKCTVNQIMNYHKKLSGPIMDRIDLHVNVPAVNVDKLLIDSGRTGEGVGEKSSGVKERIVRARSIQSQRFSGIDGVYCNSDMKNRHLKELAQVSTQANLLLKQAVNKFCLSARTYFRLVKVSRTIADLEISQAIEEHHVAEALQYRVRNE